jgi:hypothetical protein
MQIAKVLAIYRVSPPVLVVEAEDGTVLDLSLTELKDGGHRVRAVARSPDHGLVRRHARAR